MAATSSPESAPAIDPKNRRRMIAEAAWARFQARGYVHGYHQQDWFDAERDIDQRLSAAAAAVEVPAAAAVEVPAAAAVEVPAAAVDLHGFKPTVNGCDNLEIIEGIGPKIAELLVKARITTFAALAAAPPAALRAMLVKAGPRYAMAVPTTWPEQAALAVKGDWAALAALQKALRGGVRR